MPFAVSVGAVAIPLVFVLTTAVAPVVNVALTPLVGAMKVTGVPTTILPNASFTIACSAVAKAVFTNAFCGVPAVAVTVAAVPAVFVTLKFAGAATPPTVAETL